MARPLKKGLDYSCWDVDCFEDSKCIDILAQGGLALFGLYFAICQQIYRVGCCYRWDDKEQRILAYKLHLIEDEMNEGVKRLLEAGVFSAEVFKATGYLTSKGIQKRFFLAAARRTEIIIPEKVLLIDSSVYAPGVPIKESKSKRESKGKGKVKETLQKLCNNSAITPLEGDKCCNNSAITQTPPPGKTLYGKFCYLSQNEYEAHLMTHGDQFLTRALEKLDAWIESDPTPKRIKNGQNASACFRSWVFNAVAEEQGRADKITPKKSTTEKNMELLKRVMEKENAKRPAN